MAFTKGHKLAKGGKRPGAGRPTKTQTEIKKAAAEMAREYIDAHIKPFLESYRQLVAGRDVKHFNQQTGALIYTDFEVDAPTVRHAIDKFIPPVEKREHTGEIGVRPWTADVDPRLEKKKD